MSGGIRGEAVEGGAVLGGSTEDYFCTRVKQRFQLPNFFIYTNLYLECRYVYLFH